MRNAFLFLATLVLLVAAVLRLSALHAYPPGPHYDEAVNLLIARSIAYGGARPFPMVEAFQGREVLYMYVNAALLPALGDRMFTLHLTNALLGLLTVAATMALGRAMFAGWRGWVVGLVAGVLIALSFPQVWLSRQAFRAITLPFCQAFALLFLWRGLRARRGWGWLVAGGAFAGLALYTYNASRLFPFWLLAGGLLLLMIDRRRRGLRLRQGLVFFGVLALVALPMAVYALEKPDIFLGRLVEVTQPGESVTLAQSVVLHLRMFFIEGDPYLRYNIPGRPFFTWPEGLLLLVGIGVALWRLLRAGRPTERTAYALALLSPLMIVPSLISVGGLPPSHMRSIGMVPLVFVLVAVGVEFVWQSLLPRLRLTSRPPAPAFTFLLIGVLLAGGLLVRATYMAWAGRADLYYESDADLAAAADWLPAHAADDMRVYVAARDRGHPTVQIADTPPITWLGSDTLFRAPAGQRGLYVFPRSAPPPPDWLEWLEPGRLDDLPLGPDGRTAFEAFVIDGATALPALAQPPEALPENAHLSLLGTRAVTAFPGATVTIEMGWQVVAPPSANDLTPLLQLEDANETALSRADAYMTETDRWQPGEAFLQRVRLRVPYGTPPGLYPLRVAWVERAANRYVPYEQGQVWATVGQLQVLRADTHPAPAVLDIGVPADIAFAPGVRLLGWNDTADMLRPGEPLALTLFWQATPTEGPRPVVEAEALLQNVAGETLLWQGDLLDGRYGTDKWEPSELVTDHAVWRTPRDLAEGDYQLVLRSGSANAVIGALTVAGVPRVFDPPDFEQPVDATFGGAIRLVGVSSAQPDDVLTVDLVWQAQEAVDADYTVFMHLLDASGNIVAQRDVFPQEGAYPTSLWSAGEYVTDRHVFTDLPPGTYDVVVGLYSQETGQRQPVTLVTSEPSDHVKILRILVQL